MKFTTMEAILSDNVATPRFRTLLFAIFAGLAICLAMAGVYGVMAYVVSRRSKEIGVRIALGATSASVLGFVIRQGLALTGLGLIIGLIVAATGTRLLTSVLFEVQPNDPLVYVTVVLFVSISALLASYLPARRASRIDPLAAIRQE
jgi:ABC-type antimicrobial peptide transport system permease subunit